MNLAEIRLWGRRVGAVALPEGERVTSFQYDREFLREGLRVAPLMMPPAEREFRFPELAGRTFHGLPGALADSLPDRFGNALINAWLARQGRAPTSFNALERLCYTGTRGMGALDYHPPAGPEVDASQKIEIGDLVALASQVLSERRGLLGSLAHEGRADSLRAILRVGTSAGGARAKAVIAWNRQTNEMRSGQIEAGSGFEHWLLKFDGVRGNVDRDLDTPQGFGALEFAYHLMASAAGVAMNECRLLEENGRRHFMTRRFDRPAGGGKLHMQSLGALAHLDFNDAGANSYEQAFLAIRQLDLPIDQAEQMFRRMVFNVLARNQDDHVKNIAFLMDSAGRWSLAPAFDVAFNFNPEGEWTAAHQMSINGKRDGFTTEDLSACAAVALLKRGRADDILAEVRAAVQRWPTFAAAAKVAEEIARPIGETFRLGIEPKVTTVAGGAPPPAPRRPKRKM